MRVAVLGDIHGNADALDQALARVDAVGCDRLILLGDLLTYGVDVERSLTLVLDRLQSPHTTLLLGNHDTMYADIVRTGRSDYLERLPTWIRESVEWTMARLDRLLWEALRFVEECGEGGILFSHANPFGQGDWEYLNSAATCARAAEVLRDRGHLAGVFGHTHRMAWYRLAAGEGRGFVPATAGRLDGAFTHVLNPGAIGQVRDAADPVPRILWLTFEASAAPEVVFEPVPYPREPFLDRIRVSGLSATTQARLLAYFP